KNVIARQHHERFVAHKITAQANRVRHAQLLGLGDVRKMNPQRSAIAKLGDNRRIQIVDDDSDLSQARILQNVERICNQRSVGNRNQRLRHRQCHGAQPRPLSCRENHSFHNNYSPQYQSVIRIGIVQDSNTRVNIALPSVFLQRGIQLYFISHTKENRRGVSLLRFQSLTYSDAASLMVSVYVPLEPSSYVPTSTMMVSSAESEKSSILELICTPSWMSSFSVSRFSSAS